VNVDLGREGFRGEGGHDDQQKTSDSKSGVGNKPDYLAFRDQAFLHLYRSMNLAMAEMANEQLHNSVRCKWAHCLAQTVAALCNLIRTLQVLQAETGKPDDLGTLLSTLNEKFEKEASEAPKKYNDPVYREHLRKSLVRSPVWKISRRDHERWR